MRWPQIEVTRKSALVWLMGLSAVALLLPPRWTDPLKHVVQLLVPPQDLMHTGAGRLELPMTALNETARSMDPDHSAEDMLEKAALAAELADSREENARLRALRDSGLSSSIPILPAKIVARDVAAWRDSLLAARGSAHGVHPGDWASARFFVDRGRGHAVEEGQAVLSRQTLVGRVEQVSPYMSRVQLFTDIDSPRLEVRIGSSADGSSAAPSPVAAFRLANRSPSTSASGKPTRNRFEFVDYPCSLRGAGRGTMLIEGVDYRFVDTGTTEASPVKGRRIRRGDLVFGAPGQLGLPSPMVVGRVASFEEDPKRRLVFNLRVEPITPVDELREIYIIPLVPAPPVHAP